MISGQLSYRGDHYRLVVSQGEVVNRYGRAQCFNGREDAAAFLRKLTASALNEAALRRFLPRLPATRNDSARASRVQLCAELAARPDLIVVRERKPILARGRIVTEGKLTLSAASWAATSYLFPSAEYPYHPDKWIADALHQLLKARAAIHQVAPRSRFAPRAPHLEEATERMLRPYHCEENFPAADQVIDTRVCWFHVSLQASVPTHPDVPNSSLVKSYGPFYAHSPEHLGRGTLYVHFYRSTATP